MREIDLNEVTEKVKELLLEACCDVGCSFIDLLKEKKKEEESPLGKEIIERIIENDVLATKKHIPLCQDTGIVVCFLEIGSEVVFKGDIYRATAEGVRRAYREGYFRKSVVAHPLNRINTADNTPPIVHVKIVPGTSFKITVVPKGGGAENMSVVKMLTPADGREGIIKTVLDTVCKAGGKACPPLIVGVGIGGDLEKAALMAKEALIRNPKDLSDDPLAEELERELTAKINDLGIGPMGFGGRITCLKVNVNCYPCHIASLPVAVNLQCHADRHRSGKL